MTEPTPTPEGEEVSAPEPEATADESMLDDRAKAALQKARREARSLRERLHATEEQVGQLQSQVGEQAAIVSAMQLAEIKRLAGDLLHDPDDLIAHQPDMSNYFDEEFTGNSQRRPGGRAGQGIDPAAPTLGQAAAGRTTTADRSAD